MEKRFFLSDKTKKICLKGVVFAALLVGAIVIILPLLWAFSSSFKTYAEIYSYPMRFAPIKGLNGEDIHKSRDYVKPLPDGKYDLLNDAVWTRRFIRNIEVMKGAANGAISTTSTLAMRTVGKNYEEFMANLHMPEILLRNRNTYEKKIYPYEPNREPGNGKVEEFREFIMAFLKNPTDEFLTFFNTITKNSVEVIREYEKQCTNEVFRKWLNWYKKK